MHVVLIEKASAQNRDAAASISLNEKRCCVILDGMPLPMKGIISLPALFYGRVLCATHGLPRSWVLIIGIIFMLLLILTSCLKYPLGAVWPAFVGHFLLITCVLTVVRGVPSTSLVPFTHTKLELWFCALPAYLYVLWGIAAAHHALHMR
jgi:hypothetical protein